MSVQSLILFIRLFPLCRQSLNFAKFYCFIKLHTKIKLCNCQHMCSFLSSCEKRAVFFSSVSRFLFYFTVLLWDHKCICISVVIVKLVATSKLAFVSSFFFSPPKTIFIFFMAIYSKLAISLRLSVVWLLACGCQ